jgi:hypothetical protein
MSRAELAKRAAAFTIALLSTSANQSTAGPKHVAGPPELPMLPSLLLVRVEVSRDQMTIVEDVNVPRGQWQWGDLDLYIAFAAPGAPRAFDVRLFAVGPHAFEARRGDVGEPVSFDLRPRRPPGAFALLGREQMSGVVVHLREAAFRRALSFGGSARLRVRALHSVPPEDTYGGHEVVVRLGAPSGYPLALQTLELRSLESRAWVTRAEAHLCGPDADPYPLDIALTPPPVVRDHAAPRPAAPVLAVRHASDDLCVRFWTS